MPRWLRHLPCGSCIAADSREAGLDETRFLQFSGGTGLALAADARGCVDKRIPGQGRSSMRGRGNQRGQALIEVGMSITLFLAIALGLLTFGHAFLVMNMITHAARDGRSEERSVGKGGRE